MKVKDFKKLKRGDKVVITAPPDIEAVNDRIAATFDSVIPPGSLSAPSGLFNFIPCQYYREKETLERLAWYTGEPPVARRTIADVEKYTWEYHDSSLYAQRTDYDRAAVADPADFMKSVAGHSWEQAKKFYAAYKTWKIDGGGGNPPNDSLSHPCGGMQALLDYRSHLAAELIGAHRDQARENAVRRRQRVALANEDFRSAGVDFTPFFAATKAPGGDAPGSQEPTSDVDLNTFNDGTEFLVRAFNRAFANRFDGYEPGIVFDVNVYGKDFLPKLDPNFEDAERTEHGERPFVLPERDHVFWRREYQEQDAQRQLEAALLKLRRYMANRTFLEISNLDPAQQEVEKLRAAEWEQFRTMAADLVSSHPTLLRFEEIEQTYARNLERLAATVAIVHSQRTPGTRVTLTVVRDRLRQDFLRQAEAVPFTRLDPENTEDLNTLMAAENRLYELALLELADTRTEFDCAKFAKLRTVDPYYRDLRSAVSDALYFANEAYVTAGAVTQVVGGKQKLSRGVKVEARNDDQEASANIAYGADELMHSIIDNLADIYKETKRHYKQPPEQTGESQDDEAERTGAAVLKASKYIHRLFNAIKHLYLLIGIVDTYESDPDVFTGVFEDDDVFTREEVLDFHSYPEKDFSSYEYFEQFRKIGFGLEALKKLELDLAIPADEERLKTLLTDKFSIIQNAEPLVRLFKRAGRNKDYMAASLISFRFRGCLTGHPKTLGRIGDLTERQPLTIEQLRTALTYLVVDVMADYAAFRDKTTIAAAMEAAHRPYPLPGRVPVRPTGPRPPTDPRSRRGRRT